MDILFLKYTFGYLSIAIKDKDNKDGRGRGRGRNDKEQTDLTDKQDTFGITSVPSKDGGNLNSTMPSTSIYSIRECRNIT